MTKELPSEVVAEFMNNRRYWSEVHSKYREAADLYCNCHTQDGFHECPRCDKMKEAMEMLIKMEEQTFEDGTKAALSAMPQQAAMTEDEAIKLGAKAIDDNLQSIVKADWRERSKIMARLVLIAANDIKES